MHNYQKNLLLCVMLVGVRILDYLCPSNCKSQLGLDGSIPSEYEWAQIVKHPAIDSADGYFVCCTPIMTYKILISKISIQSSFTSNL